MCGADAPVVEAAVDGEREVVVDPALLEEIRDGVVDVCEHAAAGKVQDAEVLCVGVVVAEEHVNVSLRRKSATGCPRPGASRGARRCGKRSGGESHAALQGSGTSRGHQPSPGRGPGRRPPGDQRDRFAVDNPVVTLDDEVLAGTVADELSAVAGESEFGRERVPVVLPSEPVGTSGQPRLEDVGRVRPAPRQVPLIAEPGEQQLRLVSGEHRPALVVGAEITVGRGPAKAAG